jgi:hypothetical protein
LPEWESKEEEEEERDLIKIDSPSLSFYSIRPVAISMRIINMMKASGIKSVPQPCI